MISEKALYEATKEANQIMMESLPLETECRHHFSNSFENKMQQMIYKEKHRKKYHFLKRIAVLLIIFSLSASFILSFSAEARSLFSNWVKKVYENYVIYRFEDDGTEKYEQNDYIIDALPKGYKEVKKVDFSSGKKIIYENSQGEYINLSYDYSSNSQITILGTAYQIIPTTVGIYDADIYLFENPEEGNSIIWLDEKQNVLFQIDGMLDKEELVSLAESVIER